MRLLGHTIKAMKLNAVIRARNFLPGLMLALLAAMSTTIQAADAPASPPPPDVMQTFGSIANIAALVDSVTSNANIQVTGAPPTTAPGQPANKPPGTPPAGTPPTPPAAPLANLTLAPLLMQAAFTNAASAELVDITLRPDTTLPEAVAMLARTAKINYQLDPQLLSDRSSEDKPGVSVARLSKPCRRCSTITTGR